MKRQVRSAAFKKKIALEAIRERKTINEIATAFKVHPRLVGAWKKQLLENAEEIFDSPNKRKNNDKERQEQESLLHAKIGQLTIELDWLKKKIEIESF